MRTVVALALALSLSCSAALGDRLVDIHTVIDESGTLLLRQLHGRCADAVRQCVADGRSTVGQCPEWGRCDAAREGFVRSLRAVESALLALQDSSAAVQSIVDPEGADARKNR